MPSRASATIATISAPSLMANAFDVTSLVPADGGNADIYARGVESVLRFVVA